MCVSCFNCVQERYNSLSDKAVKLKALEERCLSPKSPSRVRGLEEDVSGEKRKENKVCKKLLTGIVDLAFRRINDIFYIKQKTYCVSD